MEMKLLCLNPTNGAQAQVTWSPCYPRFLKHFLGSLVLPGTQFENQQMIYYPRFQQNGKIIDYGVRQTKIQILDLSLPKLYDRISHL